MSKTKIKTNAMRILDSHNINYKMHSYDSGKDHIDGVEVAKKIGRDVSEVYKTLVAQGASKEFYVYVIPVHENLDLKKAARAANEKNVEMIHVKIAMIKVFTNIFGKFKILVSVNNFT